MSFATASAKHIALQDLALYETFYLITSHGTCNEDGERSVYLVSAISDKSKPDLDLVLSVSRMPWKKSVQTIRVDFTKSEESYRIPRQRLFGKRQALSSSETAVVEATATTSSRVSFAFPPPPTTTPTATSARQDLSFSFIDTPLLPPSFPGGESLTLEVPVIPPGISFQCKNCTVTGTIDILQGSISGETTTSGPGNDTDDNFSWDSGSFRFEMNGFSAHMELGATVEPSLSLLTFNAPMPSIALPGFQIPGFGAVGPIFSPNIVIGTEIGTQLDFTPDTEITALPFASRVDSIDLTVSAAFRPELLLGVEVLGSNLGAGIFFNLPTVAATVSQVAHVNSKCEPIPANVTSSTVDDVVEDVMESLTHIEPSVQFDFGLVAQAEIRNFDVEAIYTIFNTSFPLPTACLAFNRDEMALGVVTPSADGKAIAAATTGTGAAGKGRGNPLEGLTGWCGRLDVIVGSLLTVSVWFMSL
ncbi:MAG: hypothetical protein Q9178_003104 [Gyalolechia marmorata]